MQLKAILLLFFTISFSIPIHASLFQECKGLVTLLSPINMPSEGWLNAHFLMHNGTFDCTGDKKAPKIIGYRHESLQYTGLDIGTLKQGGLLRISYRLSEDVTLGGGGFLNWGIEEPVNPTIVTEKEQKAINKELASLRTYGYNGANFSIKYPKDFIVSIEKPVNYGSAGDANFDPYDEAYFTSPDKQVEFFVFSPLWGGKPQSYLDIAPNEVLVDDKTTQSVNSNTVDSKEYDQIITRYATIKAKSNSYFRSFVHTRKQSSDSTLKISNLDVVFGIQYKKKEAYKKYRDAYLKFKKSLIQFSD